MAILTADNYILDKAGLYKTQKFAVEGQQWSSLLSSRRVCLSSHTSLERLYWLVEIVEAWSGPISIALYISSGQLDDTLEYLKYLWRCHPRVRDQVRKTRRSLRRKWGRRRPDR